MKNAFLALVFAVFTPVLFAGDTAKEACACLSGGTCVCPEGKCVCTSEAKPEVEAEKKNCGCACCKGKDVCCCHAGDGAKAGMPVGHPLKGIVVDVLANKKSILVKHEEIPGVMKAMTMLFRVDDATLTSVKRGESITATMTEEEGGWWLRDVKPVVKE